MSSPNGRQAARLAGRLRELREHEWPGVTLTQAQLAEALSTQNKVQPGTLSTWENVNNPKTPPTPRLTAYARFFATRRSLDGKPHLIAVDELDAGERERFEALEAELLRLHASLDEAADPDRRLLLAFEGAGPIVIVCPEAPKDARGPLADETDPNHTRLHKFADADALLEVFGHIRALNPDRHVLPRLPAETQKSDLQNHLLILGGIGWNPTLRRILAEQKKRLPIEQIEDPELPTGEVFRVRDENSGDDQTYFPQIEEGDDGVQVTEDVGLVARLLNPFNTSRTLTIFNGVHSTGVLGAVLTLTDETVRPANEEHLGQQYPSGEFAMLIRVPVVGGAALAPDLKNPDVRLFEWSPTSAGV